MITARTRSVGGAVDQWSARVHCDFPACDRVLTVGGSMLPDVEWDDEKAEFAAANEGWVVAKGKQICPAITTATHQ